MEYSTNESATAELRARNRAIVVSVARGYKEACNLPAIAARDYDPNPVQKSRIWTPTVAEFKADVENAVRKILANKPDVEELRDGWERLQMEDSTPGRAGVKFIAKAAAVFLSRELEPHKYFRVKRYVRETSQR